MLNLSRSVPARPLSDPTRLLVVCGVTYLDRWHRSMPKRSNQHGGVLLLSVFPRCYRFWRYFRVPLVVLCNVTIARDPYFVLSISGVDNHDNFRLNWRHITSLKFNVLQCRLINVADKNKETDACKNHNFKTNNAKIN